MSAPSTCVMNENSKHISCLFPYAYCAIQISPPSGSIWAWREYNFPQRLTLLLSKQQEHTVVQSKKLIAMGIGIMRGSTWIKWLIKKHIWKLFSSASWAMGKKTENYICNAKTLAHWHLILATTVQRAVKIQFQLRRLRKYLRSLSLTLPPPLFLKP